MSNSTDFTYRKIKRGSIIKVRAYTNTQAGATNANRTARKSLLAHPKHLRHDEIRILGKVGTLETENKVLLLEHDVPKPNFSEAVLDCLPEQGRDWQIPPDQLQSRLDLRQLNICSVDPPGCTDIDDALHYIDLDQNTCQVGVHIADVSYFVNPKTAIDQEAASRGTTVYLADRRIDMIPDVLSSCLCSLVQHQDRLAFSAIWKMDKSTAEVLDVTFARSIINSKASLTYEQAQNMIDDKKNKSPIHIALRGLNSLAKKLKKRRMDRGALVLARADEIRFIECDSETHESDASLEIQTKKLVDTNSMVEEFMLLANIAVANKLIEAFPQRALLRRHPRPSRQDFEDLVESAKNKGFQIEPESGKSLSESLDKAKLAENNFFNLMLRMIATRCMTPASYFCSGSYDPEQTSFKHFGLAVDLYTHFTSPIRRYADLVVHRLLAAAIGIIDLDKTLNDPNRIQLICDQINYRHRMAQLASRASARLHTILYIKTKKELVEDAYVFYPSEDWHYDVDKRHQRHLKSRITLKQFDPIKVHISIKNKDDLRFADQVQVKVVQPPIDEAPTESVQMQIGLENDECEPMEEDMADELRCLDESMTDLQSIVKPHTVYKEMKRKIRLNLNQSNPSKPVIAMPGDTLEKYVPSKGRTLLGPGLMKNDEQVVANKCGILKMRNNNLFWMDCHQRRYVASKGECVIGIVRSVASQHCRVDINSADLASLSLLAFEGANKKNKPNLNVGDLVYAKVLSASKHVDTELVCVNSNGKRDGLGQIGDKGGSLIKLSIDTVRVLLSPSCNLLENLGRSYRYEIALGMNGRVWINSSETSTIVKVINELHNFDIN